MGSRQPSGDEGIGTCEGMYKECAIGFMDPQYPPVQMAFQLQPVRVGNGFDEEGLLVFDAEQRLVAVLVRLSEQHEEQAGRWFLEVGFGPIDGPNHPVFAALDAAPGWIEQRLRKTVL